MKRWLWIPSVWAGALVFTSCATLNVDKARLGAVRKVAVAGFTVHQQVLKGFEWNLSASSSDRMPGWGSALNKENEQAGEMYGRLGRVLHTDMKWLVLDRRSVEAARPYKEVFDRNRKGLQNRPPLATGMEALGAAGILDPYPIERMPLEDRAKLMKSLGVDAIAVATVKIQYEEGGGLKKLVGAGEYKPFAAIRFAVYDAKASDPLWSDLQAVGETVAEGTGHVLGATDKKDLMKKSVQAAENSYQRLIARFREQNG